MNHLQIDSTIKSITYEPSRAKSFELCASLLEPPNWLNDQIIGFAFEFFAREDIGDEQRVAFIDPAVTQMIKLCPEPYEIQGIVKEL